MSPAAMQARARSSCTATSRPCRPMIWRRDLGEHATVLERVAGARAEHPAQGTGALRLGVRAPGVEQALGRIHPRRGCIPTERAEGTEKQARGTADPFGSAKIHAATSRKAGFLGRSATSRAGILLAKHAAAPSPEGGCRRLPDRRTSEARSQASRTEPCPCSLLLPAPRRSFNAARTGETKRREGANDVEDDETVVPRIPRGPRGPRGAPAVPRVVRRDHVPSTARATEAARTWSSGEDAISRDDAISRAEEWVHAKLHYCQSREPRSPTATRRARRSASGHDNSTWDPYRSDCSGLVSWAWGLPAPGRTTLGFAPFETDITHAISAIDLEPGDAINNSDHVMLFKRWDTKNHKADFIEEPGCQRDALRPRGHRRACRSAAARGLRLRRTA